MMIDRKCKLLSLPGSSPGGHMAYTDQFLVPQIEYTLGGSSQKGSHGYFLFQVFGVILLFGQIVLLLYVNVLMLHNMLT